MTIAYFGFQRRPNVRQVNEQTGWLGFYEERVVPIADKIEVVHLHNPFGLTEAHLTGPASTVDQLQRARRAGLDRLTDAVEFTGFVTLCHYDGIRVSTYIGSPAVSPFSPQLAANVEETMTFFERANVDTVGFDVHQDIRPLAPDEDDLDLWLYETQDERQLRAFARGVVAEAGARFNEVVLPITDYRPENPSWLTTVPTYLAADLSGIDRPVYCIVPSDKTSAGQARIDRDIVQPWGSTVEADPDFVDYTTAGLTAFVTAKGLIPMNYFQDI